LAGYEEVGDEAGGSVELNFLLPGTTAISRKSHSAIRGASVA